MTKSVGCPSQVSSHASVQDVCVCVTQRRVDVSEVNHKGRGQQVKETQQFKSLCQSVSTLSAHPLIPLCCRYSSSPFHLILTKGHNTQFIRPDFLPFIHSPAPFLERLSPCLLRLSAVSFMFLQPLLTHSLCASSIVSLFWQLYRTFLRNSIFVFFLFQEKKKTHSGTNHTHAHIHLHPPPLAISFYSHSLIHPCSSGK